MTTLRTRVDADVCFRVDTPGRPSVTGQLEGRGSALTLRVSDPAAFAGGADASGLRRIAAELAELGWEKSRASHHVSRMASRGLVDKQRCDEDRRGAFVAITPAGRTAIEEAAPGHVRAVRELFVDLLTPAQLDALSAIADRVLRS